MRALFREIKTRSKNKLRFLHTLFKSAVYGNIFYKKFQNLESLCLFIGYPRSGHSLIASLLDAHPNIIIGMESGLSFYLNLGFKKKQILYTFFDSSKKYAKKGNIWTGYNYKVPESWQGRYQKLKVIGDKNAGLLTTMLIKQPDLIFKLEEKLKQKAKLIHVIRNPFDIITTSTFRYYETNKISGSPQVYDLLLSMKSILEKAKTVEQMKTSGKYEILDLNYEDFILDPSKQLKEIILFLGLKSDDTYLKSCASIVYSQPNKSRYKLDWPKELIQYIECEIQKYPALQHYRYYE